MPVFEIMVMLIVYKTRVVKVEFLGKKNKQNNKKVFFRNILNLEGVGRPKII